MAHCADTADGLELLVLRERMRAWRFYDDLRTDRDAPARRPQVGTFTPVLAGDGSDVGAAIQTIREIGDAAALREAIADAFDGATIGVGDRFEVEMQQHGLLRPLGVAELSDGTLRYILLAAALLSPRPPESDDPQRTRGEPPPRPARPARAAAGDRVRAVPDHRRVARRGAGRGAGPVRRRDCGSSCARNWAKRRSPTPTRRRGSGRGGEGGLEALRQKASAGGRRGSRQSRRTR